MDRQVIFRDYQEQVATDHNNLQDYVQTAMDNIVSDGISNTRKYSGLMATKILLEKPALFDDYILVSPSLWRSSISQFGTNIGWVFIPLMLPRYLAEVHHVPVLQRGWMSSMPLLLGMAGMLNVSE